jgi:hypothetical protein
MDRDPMKRAKTADYDTEEAAKTVIMLQVLSQLTTMEKQERYP